MALQFARAAAAAVEQYARTGSLRPTHDQLAFHSPLRGIDAVDGADPSAAAGSKTLSSLQFSRHRLALHAVSRLPPPHVDRKRATNQFAFECRDYMVWYLVHNLLEFTFNSVMGLHH